MSPLLLSLATLVLEMPLLKAALAKIDARPVPDLLRAVATRDMLDMFFPTLWEMLSQHEELGKRLTEEMRTELFETLFLLMRARSHTSTPTPAWTRSGPRAAAPSPAESSDHRVGYALVYDPQREKVVYLSGSSESSFGQCWEWREGSWRSVPVIEHAIAAPHCQGFRGFHDRGRGGIACWTLVRVEAGEPNHYRPLGLLLREDRVELIEAGNPPTVAGAPLFEFGAIFGIDPHSGDTLLLIRGAIFALRSGSWLKLCDLEDKATSKEWASHTRATFEHEGQLHFCWVDTDNLGRRIRLARFTGQGLQEVHPKNPPGRPWSGWLAAGRGARFVTQGQQWCLVGSGDDLSWRRLSAAPPLPLYDNAWGVVVADGGILLGPGQYSHSGDELRPQRCFFHINGTLVQRMGEPLEGVGAVPADRTLLGREDHVCSVYRDGQVDIVYRDHHRRLAATLPGATLVLAAICLDGAGTLTAVASDAAVWQLFPDGWQRVGEASADVAAWTIRCCAWDAARGRLVVWGTLGTAHNRSSERTGSWANGTWTRLEAGSILRPDDTRSPSELDVQMIFDTQQQRVVFFSGTTICVLGDAGWHVTAPQTNIYRAISSGSAFILHDQGSATTLFLDTKERWCGRLAGTELERAGTIDSPRYGLSTFAGSGDARRAAMVYVPSSQSVIVYSGVGYDAFWELPLASLLPDGADGAAGAAGAPSTASAPAHAAAAVAPAKPPFAGPKLQRCPEPATARSEPDAVRFRHFGAAPPSPWPLPTIARDELLLRFDPLRARLIMARKYSSGLECWHRVGEVWQLLHRYECSSFSATLRLSSDPRRGVVLWWIDDDYGAVGYRISDGGLEPLETTGDRPMRDADYSHREKVAFAWDRRERRILACSAKGLWSLDDDERWTCLATWEDTCVLRQLDSFGSSDGGAWDVAGQRFVMWKVDAHGLRCWAISASGIIAIDEASVPDGTGAVLAEAEHGLLRFARATRTTFRLEPSGWVATDLGEGAPALEVSSDVAMVSVGDGDLELASARPFQFHSRVGGLWKMAGVATGHRPVTGEVVSRHRGNLFASSAYDAMTLVSNRWQGAPPLIDALLSMPWRGDVGPQLSICAASVQADDAPIRILCGNGIVGLLHDDRWELWPPHALDFDRGHGLPLAAYSATEAAWLVIFKTRRLNVVARCDHSGHWQKLESLPTSDGSARFSPFFDSRHGGFAVVVNDTIFRWHGDTWVPRKLESVPRFDHLVHDLQTGTTLLLTLDDGKIYALGESACTQLRGRPSPPLPMPHCGAIPPFALKSAAFDQVGRRLVLLGSHDDWSNFEFDLSPFFEQAAALP